MTSFPRPPSDLLLGNSPRSPRSRRGVVLYFFVNPVNPDSSLSWGSGAKRSIIPWKVFSTCTLNRFIKMVCLFSLFQIYSIFSQIYIVILQCPVHENKCYDSSYLVYFLVSSKSYHNDYSYIQIFFEHFDFTKTIL